MLIKIYIWYLFLIHILFLKIFMTIIRIVSNNYGYMGIYNFTCENLRFLLVQ